MEDSRALVKRKWEGEHEVVNKKSAVDFTDVVAEDEEDIGKETKALIEKIAARSGIDSKDKSSKRLLGLIDQHGQQAISGTTLAHLFHIAVTLGDTLRGRSDHGSCELQEMLPLTAVIDLLFSDKTAQTYFRFVEKIRNDESGDTHYGLKEHFVMNFMALNANCWPKLITAGYARRFWFMQRKKYDDGHLVSVVDQVFGEHACIVLAARGWNHQTKRLSPWLLREVLEEIVKQYPRLKDYFKEFKLVQSDTKHAIAGQ